MKLSLLTLLTTHLISTNDVLSLLYFKQFNRMTECLSTAANIDSVKEVFEKGDDKDIIQLQHSHIDSEWCDSGIPKVSNESLYGDLKRAKFTEITICEGDGLFIPSYTWHWVFSEDRSVAVQLFHNVPSEGISVKREQSYYLGGQPESIEQAIATSQPILLKEMATHWPCMEWTVEKTLSFSTINRFVESKGHSLCPIEKPNPFYDDTGTSRTDTNELPQLINSSNSTIQYQWVVPLTPSTKALQDIRMPSFLNPREVSNINVWCNTGRVHTGLHYDLQDNILIGVKGKKRVLLAPQSETPYLYHKPFLRRHVKAWK